MIFLTIKSDVMIKGKYNQLCLHRQYSGICAIGYTQTLCEIAEILNVEVKDLLIERKEIK